MSKKLMIFIVLAATLLTGCGSSLESPPLVYLVADGALVDGFQSSYCWDGGSSGTLCVDTIEPYFDSSTPLNATAPIRLQLDSPLPEGVTLSISKEIFGETILAESMSPSDFIEWSPAVAPGAYILDVHASWNQGDVTYWFSVSLE